MAKRVSKSKSIKQIVCVCWEDIHFHQNWNEHDPQALLNTDLPIFRSIGILIRKSNPVTIAATVTPDEDGKPVYSDITRFPKGCIQSIDTIGELDISPCERGNYGSQNAKQRCQRNRRR